MNTTQGSPDSIIPEIHRIPREQMGKIKHVRTKRQAPALTDPFAHHVAHQTGLALGALAGVLVARGVRALWLRYTGAKS